MFYKLNDKKLNEYLKRKFDAMLAHLKSSCDLFTKSMKKLEFLE